MKEHIKPLIATLVFYIIFVLIVTSSYNFNPTALIRVGKLDYGYGLGLVQKGMVVLDENGYDGQFYYYAAQDIFMNKGFEQSYNYQRIGYPFAVWLFSLGIPAVIPYMMLVVNLLAILIGTYFLILILKKYNLSPWWALVYSLNIGFLIEVYYSLVSPLAFCFIIIGIYFYEKENMWLTSIFLALSLLTRESALLVIVPLCLYLFLDRFITKKQGSIKNMLIICLSIIPFIIWQIVLYFRFGEIVFLKSSGTLNPFPFVETIKYISNLNFSSNILAWSVLPILIFALVTLVSQIWKIVKVHGEDNLFLIYPLIAGFHGFFVFFLKEGPILSHSITSIGRVVLGIFPFVLLSYAEKKEIYSKWLLYCSLALSFMLTIALFVYPSHGFFVYS